MCFNWITSLDDIHDNDWALYAGVESVNKDYGKISDIISISVFCVTKRGKVKIWLESIGTEKRTICIHSFI